MKTKVPTKNSRSPLLLSGVALQCRLMNLATLKDIYMERGDLVAAEEAAVEYVALLRGLMTSDHQDVES